MYAAVSSLAQRPDMMDAIANLSDEWPEFMLHDMCGSLLYDVLSEKYAEFCLLAATSADSRSVLGRAYSVPFFWPYDFASQAPPSGWSEILAIAAIDQLVGRSPNMVCAVEITVRRPYRRQGLAKLLLNGLRDNARQLGFSTLVAPVRPITKHRYPSVGMSEYLSWRGNDGLSFDPWIRLHQRLGGRVLGVAPRSMTIVGSTTDWEQWTKQSFRSSGFIYVDEGLVPVHSDPGRDCAVYVEPNVWVIHDL